MVRCKSGKRSFPTRDAAREALIRQRQNPREALFAYSLTGKLSFRAYHCPDCGQWHLSRKETIA